MSSTRYAESGSPLRQGKYASNPAFMDYLKASAVARKSGLLLNPIHKELCLHLQYISMQSGGLTSFVAEFLKSYGNRIGSLTMRKYAGEKIFNADIVRAVRDELSTSTFAGEKFPLKGEVEITIADIYPSPCIDYESQESIISKREERECYAANLPTCYPATTFIEYCLDYAERHLTDWLVRFCLDPSVRLDNPPCWFHELETSLLDYLADCRSDSAIGKVVTSIGEQINDALDYAWEEKVMIHINGIARIGKTYQIKEWCAAYPGRVRYVQTPAGNDDNSFFRAIARALGTAAGSAYKNSQIKRNIEDAIQDADIMLVLDEAHYLWPQHKDARSSPRRVNWLLTEVVNKGIPVALVSTPQFDNCQKTIVNGSGWASEQLDGRISYRIDLPNLIPQSDLAAIGRHYLPDVEKEVIGLLCWYALTSGKFLAGIEAATKRARYLVRKTGKTRPSLDEMVLAIQQVDPGMKEDLSRAWAELGKKQPVVKPMQRECIPSTRNVHSPKRQPELVV